MHQWAVLLLFAAAVDNFPKTMWLHNLTPQSVDCFGRYPCISLLGYLKITQLDVFLINLFQKCALHCDHYEEFLQSHTQNFIFFTENEIIVFANENIP